MIDLPIGNSGEPKSFIVKLHTEDEAKTSLKENLNTLKKINQRFWLILQE